MVQESDIACRSSARIPCPSHPAERGECETGARADALAVSCAQALVAALVAVVAAGVAASEASASAAAAASSSSW